MTDLAPQSRMRDAPTARNRLDKRLLSEAEGEGFEPSRDETAPNGFRDLTHLAQPCVLRPGARHNARQFAPRGLERLEFRRGTGTLTLRDWALVGQERALFHLGHWWLGLSKPPTPRRSPDELHDVARTCPHSCRLIFEISPSRATQTAICRGTGLVVGFSPVRPRRQSQERTGTPRCARRAPVTRARETQVAGAFAGAAGCERPAIAVRFGRTASRRPRWAFVRARRHHAACLPQQRSPTPAPT